MYGSTPWHALATVVGALGKISPDMHALADVIAAAKAADHLQFFIGSAKEFRGMFRKRLIWDRDNAAHFGWARLLHDRR